MKPKLQVGSAVECKYFNTPDNKFYGAVWSGKVLKIEKHLFNPTGTEMGYLVEHVGTELPASWMRRKEIKTVLWSEREISKDNAPFKIGESVRMWRDYLVLLHAETYTIKSCIKVLKGCQSGWLCDASNDENGRVLRGFDSDWFVGAEKYREREVGEVWTAADTANYQDEERSADAHLDDSDMNEEVCGE